MDCRVFFVRLLSDSMWFVIDQDTNINIWELPNTPNTFIFVSSIEWTNIKEMKVIFNRIATSLPWAELSDMCSVTRCRLKDHASFLTWQFIILYYPLPMSKYSRPWMISSCSTLLNLAKLAMHLVSWSREFIFLGSLDKTMITWSTSTT